MNKTLWIFAAFILLVMSCKQRTEDSGMISEPLVNRDLQEIKEDGTLKAITIYSYTSYFLYRGQALGFEYELLQRLADHLELDLEIVIAEDINELVNMLNRGEGDLIAHGLTVTSQRKEYMRFTRHHFSTHQSLVQKKPEGWRNMKLHEIQAELINDPLELIGDTVHVRKNSSYYQRLQNLSEEIGGKIHIDTVSGDLPTEEIIRMVEQGKIKYTVADHNIAAINKTYYPDLDINTPISFDQRIAWAVRKNSPDLLNTINAWISSMKKEVDYYVIYNKYFKNKKGFEQITESEFYSKNTNKISPWDSIVKIHADSIGWDWRMLASLIYQESRFQPDARSWVGARGLMQIMPATGRSLGLQNFTDPEENIEAGTKYLKSLEEIWTEIPDSVQRIKFVMASYNCGYNHVEDAFKLAEKYGADPYRWDENVEEYILNLSARKYFNDEVVDYGYVRGAEPYEYVREIFDRYEQYRQFVVD